MSRINDEDMSRVSGGLRNVDKLEALIRDCKAKGMPLFQIQRLILTQPVCEEFLYPVRDETGKLIGLEGAGDLNEYLDDYYNSLTLPEVKSEEAGSV